MQPRKRYATKKNICNQEKDMQSRKIYAIRQKEMQLMTKDKRKKIIPLFKKIKQTDLRIFFFANFAILMF